MSEYNDIKSLLDEISKTRSVLDEIDKYYREFLTNELKILGKSRGAGIILAEIMTDFYTCAETLFLRISRFFENSLDHKKWHNDLLRKMTMTVEQLRPQVLANETYAILIEFLKFRHFRRYYFEFEYDWDKLDFLQKKYEQCRFLLLRDLTSFENFLRQL